MFDLLDHPLLFVALFPVIFAFAFPVISRNNLVFILNPVGRILVPGDKEIAPLIWNLFAYAAEQVQPLGFVPVGYYRIDAYSPGSISALAYFVNPQTNDSVLFSATVALDFLRPEMIVEFGTTCQNGIDVDTSDYGRPRSFRKVPEHSVWEFPNLRDITALHQLHQCHLKSVSMAKVVRDTDPHAGLHQLLEGRRRFILRQVNAGVLTRGQNESKCVFSWPAAFRTPWKQLPPLRQIIQSRLFKSAQVRYRESGLGDRFESGSVYDILHGRNEAAALPPWPAGYGTASAGAETTFKGECFSSCLGCWTLIGWNDGIERPLYCAACARNRGEARFGVDIRSTPIAHPVQQ